MIITKELAVLLIEQRGSKSELLAVLEREHALEGTIVDDISKKVALVFSESVASKATVTLDMCPDDLAKMIATTLTAVEAHVTKEKGPRKRSGGKWKSKWDRWG